MSDAATRWQRLEQIVHAALERSAGERAAFLAEACGGDEDLRREAASLVDRDDRADAFLAAPLAELAANAVMYSPDAAPDAGDSRNLVGVRLGDYEIRAWIGAGGMGEVYRARDHALHRDVAIKLLPAAFATDRERLARFERESRLLASLNHPHIGAIYGFAGTGDLRGIVLELIDGETLEARLAHGPIPLTQALAIAMHVAGALDHAHQRGVMHRDLKPANIMLTRGGVKLLDFGLAKWGGRQSGYRAATASASNSSAGAKESVTSEGTILGSLHYMAPEQLEGRTVDARADVFAFGAVLHEMLTGRKAFDGGSTAAVMAAVLNTQPAALDAVQRLSSPVLERVVRKCLAKNPDDRWQTTRDLADELKWIADEAARPSPSERNHGMRLPWLNRWATLGAVALGLALAGWAGWRIGSGNQPPAARTLVRFSALPSTDRRIGSVDISADGTRLVYSSAGRLYLRQLDEPTDVPIPGSEEGWSPAFSPDGQWVAFNSQGRLMKVNVQAATSPILLWEGVGRGGEEDDAVWLDNGTIVVARLGRGLMRVSAGGGEPEALTSLTETPPEFDHHSPSLLPGGQALLFTVHGPGGFKVVAEVLPTRERKVLIESACDALYVSTGHLVFARERTILAVPFDLRRLEVTGPPVNLIENVSVDVFHGNGRYSLSKNGTLVFQPAISNAGRTLVWVDRKGNEIPIPIPARAVRSPGVSPDGQRLAFAVADGGRRDVWTYELATAKLARITREGDNRTPVWARDGRRLTFTSTRGGSPELFWQSVDGGGASEHLVTGDLGLEPGGWSADGKLLVYSDGGTGPSGISMFSVTMDGNRQPTPLLHGPGEQWNPRVSPDGRWLAYTSTEAQRPEVFVSDFPNFASRHQVSIDGGLDAQWGRRGQELVYRIGQRIFSVSVDTTRGFTSGKPQELFTGRYALFDYEGIGYDVAPDGRLLMIKPDLEELASPGLRVVLNWADELARRVPTGQ